MSGKHGAWRTLLIVAALVAVTLAVFAPVRHFDFVAWDDPLYVTENPHVAAGLTWQGARWALTTGDDFYWHPLTWLSHMLDVELYGQDAGGHHVTNLIFHVASTLLLFGLLRRTTGRVGPSAFVAALFAIHPLHVESVAWVAERKDVLSTFFLMLSLAAYSWYAESLRPGRYVAVLLLYVLGLMAKPMLVTLPLVLLLFDVWPLRRLSFGGPGEAGGAGPSARRAPRARVGWLLLEKAPFLVLSLASSVLTFLNQASAGSVRDLGSFPLQLRAANALMSYVIYAVKMMWPAGLAGFYPHPTSMPSWWVVLGAALLLAVLTLGAVRAAPRYPYVLVGWLWYVVTLVPVIGLVLVGDQARADRFTYVPLIGLFIVVAWGVPDLVARWPHRRYILAAAAAVAVLCCAAVARAQVWHWQDNLALWTRAAQVTTNNQRAHASLGFELARVGRLDEAAAHFAEALRIVPDAADLHNALGDVRAKQGRLEDALAHYSTALRVKPDYDKARANLAALLERLGRPGEAVVVYEERVRRQPGSAAAHNSLGVALAGQGRFDEGVKELREAVRLDPGYARAHLNLGVALELQGLLADATAEYANATRLKPEYALAFQKLGVSLAKQGRLGEAVPAMTEALRLEPGNADWHADLGLMLDASGDRTGARRQFQTALAINPAHETARRALEASPPNLKR
jgi:Flp pilus assembly protein TadD